MAKNIKELLEDEIKKELKELSRFPSGSKEKASAIEDLTKLHRLKMEEFKFEFETDEKVERRKNDYEQHQNEYAVKEAQIVNEENNHSFDRTYKTKQLLEQVKDRYFRVGIGVAEILLPLLFYAVWMRKGFKFEETGTFTSTTFRGLFNKIKPTKK